MPSVRPTAILGDECWWPDFSGTGVGNEVSCTAIYRGQLIIGGYFDQAGGIPGTAAIAGWDGNQWQSLGANFNSPVHTLAVFNDELYAGGGFISSGGAVANFLARWDGSTWRSVGTPPNNRVYTLVEVNGQLYAGGEFTAIGGVSANHIARWNGISWNSMGNGFNGSVNALTQYQGGIVAGGYFTQSGATPLNRIARWDGTAWQTLGTGVSPDIVNALTVGNGLLYAGGYFVQAGGITVNHVACWNGTSWSPLGTGVGNEVFSLQIVNSELWAGGTFQTAGGQPARSLAKWDGLSWQPFGNGLALELGNGYVSTINSSDDSVFVGGVFQNADGVEALMLALWSDNGWRPMASSGNGTLHNGWTVEKYQGDLYSGGSYVRAGGKPILGLGRYDWSEWFDLGNTGGSVTSFAKFNNRLVVGGGFVSLSGGPLFRIGQWDGNSWSPMGSGMNNSVLGLKVVSDALYATGLFTTAGGVPANRIARWNGTEWAALGIGLSGGSSPAAYTVAEYHGSIYVGGRFTNAGGVPAQSIARWDGSGWYSVGGGVQGMINGQPFDPVVYDLQVHDGLLYLGGTFSHAGGLSAGSIVAWDGAAWHYLPNGVGGIVYAMDTYGSRLIVGGDLNGGNVKSWDGANWAPLGSGTNKYVRGMSVIDGSLYVVGAFQSAGNKSSFGIARWIDSAVSAVSDTRHGRITQSTPNPFRGETKIGYEIEKPGVYFITIHDSLGRLVQTLVSEELSGGTHEISWDGRDGQRRLCPTGMYFVQIRGSECAISCKILLQR